MRTAGLEVRGRAGRRGRGGGGREGGEDRIGLISDFDLGLNIGLGTVPFSTVFSPLLLFNCSSSLLESLNRSSSLEELLSFFPFLFIPFSSRFLPLSPSPFLPFSPPSFLPFSRSSSSSSCSCSFTLLLGSIGVEPPLLVSGVLTEDDRPAGSGGTEDITCLPLHVVKVLLLHFSLNFALLF